MFDTGTFHVTCEPHRYEIRTTNPDYFDKIHKVAERLFDILLPHTYVSEFWLEFAATFSGLDKNLHSAFGRLASSLPVNVMLSHHELSDFTVSEPRFGSKVSVNVRKTNNQSVTIRTSINYNRSKSDRGPMDKSTTSPSSIGYYSLQEYFDNDFDRYRREAETRAETIFTQLLEMG